MTVIDLKARGWLYFAAVELRSRKRGIKIGWSANIRRRIYQLETGDKRFSSLTFLGARRASFSEEKVMHRKFAEFLLQDREIFWDVPIIRDYVLSTCDLKLGNFPKKSVNNDKTSQISFRIPIEWLVRAEAIAKKLSEDVPKKTTDAFRLALFRGFRDLEREFKIRVETNR